MRTSYRSVATPLRGLARVSKDFSLPGRVALVAVAAISTLLTPSQASAQSADDLKAVARTVLASPYYTSPSKCHEPWAASLSGDVYALEPWGAESGLQRGDRLTRIGSSRLDSAVDWIVAMQHLPGGQDFEVGVDRKGAPAVVTLVCRSHIPYVAASRSLYESILAGRWSQCVQAADSVDRIFGGPTSDIANLRLQCRSMHRPSPSPADVGFGLHRVGSLAIDELQFTSDKRDGRTFVVQIIAALSADFPRLSSDLQERLSALERPVIIAPPPAEAPKANETSAAPTQGFSTGTGFAVSANGHIITAFHVVDGATAIAVQCGNQSAPASVVAHSPLLDVALIRAEFGSPTSPVPFAKGGTIALGARVFTVGFPATNVLGADPKYTEGTVSGLSGPGGDRSFLQVSVPIQPGNSGGALFDEKGAVVGVVLATASVPSFLKSVGTLPQNINWAVRGSLAKALADDLPEATVAVTREQAIKRATDAACLIVVSAATDKKAGSTETFPDATETRNAPESLLNAVDSMNVVVEDVDDEARSCGINKNGLDSAIRVPLSGAGVTLDSRSPNYVYVNVNVLRLDSGTGICVASVAVSLNRTVPGYLGSAEVWDTGTLMTGSSADFGRRISQAVEDGAKKLIGALLKARQGR